MNHFQLIVMKRIEDHKAAEAKRLEAERERIRAEEAAKLRAEEDARQRAAQQPEVEIKRVAVPVARDASGKSVMPAAKSRPTDDEIIAALASHYQVPASTVIDWLRAMRLLEAA